MADRNWTGSAVAIADVYTDTIGGTWAAGSDTYSAVINGRTMTITFGATATVTTSAIATAIAAAFNGTALSTGTTVNALGSSIPEMQAITASASGSTVIYTADVAGVPLTITSSKSSTSGTVSMSHTTTATGPNYWDNAGNWAEGSVPVSSDDVYIDRPVSILYGLAQSAVTLTSLTISDLFTAQIGLPARNSAGYEEYRGHYLAISATTINCRSNSGRIKINVGSVQTACNVYKSGSTVETGRAAFQFLGTSASNVVNVYGGDVAIAGNAGEASTIATVRQTSGTLTIGAGSTITTIDKGGGTLTSYVGCTTLTSDTGTTTVDSGAGTITTANINGGDFSYPGTGTITTINARACTIRFDGNTAGVTVTTINITEPVTIYDRSDRVTYTNQPNYSGGVVKYTTA